MEVREVEVLEVLNATSSRESIAVKVNEPGKFAEHEYRVEVRASD